MIGYLKGKILDCAEGRILLAVGGEHGAVGYGVAVPTSASYLGYKPGNMAELYVYTHVREDALDLYGFSSAGEKELFLTLLSVNGIGPKVALGLLSGADASELIQAIMGGDKEFLRNLPGIGKKTAERVVLELADPIRKKVEGGTFGGFAHGTVTRSALAELARAGSSSGGETTLVRDAKTALIGLGYRDPVAAQMVARAIEGFDEEPTKVEELIRSALQKTI
jgi:Holliday junction DNA helicase RuvA